MRNLQNLLKSPVKLRENPVFLQFFGVNQGHRYATGAVFPGVIAVVQAVVHIVVFSKSEAGNSGDQGFCQKAPWWQRIFRPRSDGSGIERQPERADGRSSSCTAIASLLAEKIPGSQLHFAVTGSRLRATAQDLVVIFAEAADAQVLSTLAIDWQFARSGAVVLLARDSTNRSWLMELALQFRPIAVLLLTPEKAISRNISEEFREIVGNVISVGTGVALDEVTPKNDLRPVGEREFYLLAESLDPNTAANLSQLAESCPEITLISNIPLPGWQTGSERALSEISSRSDFVIVADDSFSQELLELAARGVAVIAPNNSNLGLPATFDLDLQEIQFSATQIQRLNLLQAEEVLAATSRNRQYLERNFRWEQVIERIAKVIGEL